MDLICCFEYLRVFRKKKNIETQKEIIACPAENYKKFLDSVIEEKSFRVSEIIQCGYFGGSIIAKNGDEHEEIKVRILRKEYAGKSEMEWKKLNHRNILSLLKLEYLQKKESYLFYSSAQKITLEEKIKEKLFKRDPQALWKIVQWLEDIADAVQYLHSSGYAHMDLQASSMTLTREDVVQISTFHHLNSVNSRSDKFGIPQPLRSPETFFDNAGTCPVKPKPFDSWSFGILIAELFTNFYLSKKLPEKVSIWTKEAYPVIYDVLQKCKFKCLVRKSFPKAQSTIDLKTIRHLVAYTLSFDPAKRPPAKQLHHLFIMLNLQKNFFAKIKMQLRKDKIWERKIESKNIQQRFESLSIENNLELMREENWHVNNHGGENNIGMRSTLKGEKQSQEHIQTTADNNIETGSPLNSEEVDRLVINNRKQTSTKEKKNLLKPEDTIKMTYTAFTCHDTSPDDTAVFDIKSANSEISGVTSDETKINSSKAQIYQENVQISRLNFGDISSREEIEQQPQQNTQNSILYSNDTCSHSNVNPNAQNKFKKEMDTKPEGHSNKIIQMNTINTLKLPKMYSTLASK